MPLPCHCELKPIAFLLSGEPQLLKQETDLLQLNQLLSIGSHPRGSSSRFRVIYSSFVKHFNKTDLCCEPFQLGPTTPNTSPEHIDCHCLFCLNVLNSDLYQQCFNADTTCDLFINVKHQQILKLLRTTRLYRLF